MLRLPTKAPSAAAPHLAAELNQIVEVAYGEFAADATKGDTMTLKRAQEFATRGLANKDSEELAAASQEAQLLYYAMLERLQAKLGAEIRDQKTLVFSWRGALDTSEKCSAADAVLELAAVGWNLAAALSTRGAAPPLADAEATKAAVRHFQHAAGVLAHVQA